MKLVVILTRLNGKQFTINAIYIEQIESFPDTTITLTSGKKLIVCESEELVTEKIVRFYQSITILGHHRDMEGQNFEE